MFAVDQADVNACARRHAASEFACGLMALKGARRPWADDFRRIEQAMVAMMNAGVRRGFSGRGRAVGIGEKRKRKTR
jgi:hypothetical protein